MINLFFAETKTPLALNIPYALIPRILPVLIEGKICISVCMNYHMISDFIILESIFVETQKKKRKNSMEREKINNSINFAHPQHETSKISSDIVNVLNKFKQ